MWTKRGRSPGWRTVAVVLLGAMALIATACGGEEIVEKIVVQTVVVEKQIPGEKVVETVVVEKVVAGETVKVVETVIVEKPVTRVEKVVETIIVEKIVAGETVKVVETVIVERVVEKEVEKIVLATPTPGVAVVAPGGPKGTLRVAVANITAATFAPSQLKWPNNTQVINWGVGSPLLWMATGPAPAWGEITGAGIATSWTVAPDLSKTTFNLRRGIQFTEG